MKIIEYLFRKVIPLFFGALIFFAMVLVLVDLMMNLWNFISNGVSGLKVLRIMALYVPKCFWYATPIAILFAVSYTLSDLYANNELIAIFASGISLTRFTFPLLIFAFGMSFALFFFDDKIVVPTYAKKTAEQEEVLNKDKTLNNDKIVILSENGNICYKADFYDDGAKRLSSLYIIIRKEDKSLDSIIRADSASWHDEKWLLSGGIQYTQKDGSIKAGSVSQEILDRLTEPPETFQNNVISVETVDSATAKVYIEHLQKAGLPFAEPMSLYYKKYSFPFILFIVVFLSVGLSGKTRKNVMLMSLASCISAAVLFYVTQMITMLLAKFGAISPFMGAWFPVFMFVVIATVVLRYART
ncbi:MAG: LptF/LptG family permease [Treponema sp.]|uniref:LptF/LptG family permease n=1 Tax=Treponema sp. TaxID=166 RepID=UPI001B74E3D1|nr:LptF/LptG family permease [Treponema sp.]MBP3773661.1 LptF/LptG family permease [Treponema sp.]MBQ9282515.1 LptF/LptG family permease [Treponema sp.]